MLAIEAEISAAIAARERSARHACARAALQLACGVDLDTALASSHEARVDLVARVRRRLERERLKGLSRHWSYDLNRHIAIKSALDMIAASMRSP